MLFKTQFTVYCRRRKSSHRYSTSMEVKPQDVDIQQAKTNKLVEEEFQEIGRVRCVHSWSIR